MSIVWNHYKKLPPEMKQIMEQLEEWERVDEEHILALQRLRFAIKRNKKALRDLKTAKKKLARLKEKMKNVS